MPAYHVLRSVLAPGLLNEARERVDEVYREIADHQRAGDFTAIQRRLPPGERFAFTVSSFTVGAVLERETIGRVLAACATDAAGECLRAELGPAIACDLDQTWVRRQYAPPGYPRWHSPHSWHQDGALGFDFLAHPDGNFPPDAVLPMVTCWIALTPCGEDAPGLEFVTRRLDGLLSPVDLAETSVRARFRAEEFWRPVLAAGDAVVFSGDVLHHTHVAPSMTRDRTSLELRFFSEPVTTARLKADRFVALPSVRTVDAVTNGGVSSVLGLG